MILASQRNETARSSLRTDCEPERVVLFASTSHWFMRILWGIAALEIVFSIVSNAIHGFREAWLAVAALVIYPLALLLTATHLRACAIYGTRRGVEIVWGKWSKVVPWSQVNEGKFEWWSKTYVGRMARLTYTEGDAKRSVLFFAHHQALEDLERMRSSHS